MKRPRWTGLSAKALGRAAYVAAYRARRRQRDGTDRAPSQDRAVCADCGGVIGRDAGPCAKRARRRTCDGWPQKPLAPARPAA